MKKVKGQIGFFDEENRLEKLNSIIDFEPLEKQLKKGLYCENSGK